MSVGGRATYDQMDALARSSTRLFPAHLTRLYLASMSTTCSVFCGLSLDGFIARSDGALDFLEGDGTAELGDHGYEAFMSGIDAIVMGRHSFEKVMTPAPADLRSVVLDHRRVSSPTSAGSVRCSRGFAKRWREPRSGSPIGPRPIAAQCRSDALAPACRCR